MGRRLLHGGDGSEAADTELSLRTGGNSGGGARPVPAASPEAFRSPAPSPRSPLGRRHHQPLTIFYGGRICVCDVTEVQARSIIIAAAQGGTTTTAAAEERELAAVTAAAREEEQAGAGSVLPRPADVAAPEQLGPGLSMKASLQRFLQERKSRAAAAAADSGSPYARPHDHLRQHPHQQRRRQQQLQASLFL